MAQIDGYANFIFQIEPLKGSIYKQRINAILEKYNYKAEHPVKLPSKKPQGSTSIFGGFMKKISAFLRKLDDF